MQHQGVEVAACDGGIVEIEIMPQNQLRLSQRHRSSCDFRLFKNLEEISLNQPAIDSKIEEVW
jgi:hypothetical protein